MGINFCNAAILGALGNGQESGRTRTQPENGEEMKSACKYERKDDGKFWMSIEDYVANSKGADYARTFGPNWHKLTHYQKFQKGAMTATPMWPYKAAAGDEIGFTKDDKVDVISIAPGWWYGKVAGSDHKGYFPGNYVRLDNRPVTRFDLKATAAEDASRPLTVVIMLMQSNSKMQRRFFKRKQDGLNYKDTSYPCMSLTIVDPTGKVALKKEGFKRCVSGEVHLQSDSIWRVYAHSVDGRGGDFSVRVYVKEGTATLKEVVGATIDELAGAIAAR